jgi:hypothetical protein
MRNLFLLPLLVMSIFVIQSLPAYSVEWNYVASFKPTGEDYYIDLHSINVEDQTVTFWVKRMPKEQRTYHMDKLSINCKGTIFTVRQSIEAEDDESAVTEFIAKEHDLEWIEIPQDSFVHVFQELLCIDNQPNVTIIDLLRATK